MNKFLALALCIITCHVGLSLGTFADWKTLRTTGFEPPLTGVATLTQVGNKLLYAFGVREPYFNQLNVWFNTTHALDLDTNEWERVEASNPPVSRAFHCSFENDGRLFTWGGSQFNNNNFLYFNDLNALDLGTSTWETIDQYGDIPTARAASSCVKVDSKVYLIGGGQGLVQYNDVYELDLNTYTWTNLFASNTSSDAYPRGRVSAAVGYYPHRNSLYWMVGEEVAFVGGSFVATQLDDVWKFSLNSGEWSNVQKRSTWIEPVADVSFTSDNRWVFIYGGDLNTNEACCGTFPTRTSDELWVFSMKNEAFHLLPQDRTGAPPLKRAALTLVDHGSKKELYLRGGYDFDAANGVGPIANPSTYVRSLSDMWFIQLLEELLF